MFDYSLTHWVTFLTASVLLSLSPGPDMAYILAQTARHGRRAGFSAMFGIWTGAFVHVVLAAVGLSAILATSAAAFSISKWAGAAYLIYIGIQSLLSVGDRHPSQTPPSRSAATGIYKQGVVIATLNPKVAIFFLAFLPQFVIPGQGPVSAQLFLHGCLTIVAAAFIEPPIVLLGEKISDRARHSAMVSAHADRALGVLLIGLGVRLAFTDRF